jgi:hypothetical protein
MSTIKWGQRCIARRFETVHGVVDWELFKEECIGKECCVIQVGDDDNPANVVFEDYACGMSVDWLTSALEPIPETPSVWWPEIGEDVMYKGNAFRVISSRSKTHKLDSGIWANIFNLSPVTTTEITPEEAVKLLEQHTGKSFTIKSK